MVKKLVSRSSFAQMCGVSPAAVTKACSSSLQPACVGKRIDLAHPAAVKYLDGKTGVRPDKPEKPAPDKVEQRISKPRAKPSTPPEEKTVHIKRGRQAAREAKKTEAWDRANAKQGGESVTASGDDEIIEVPDDIQAFADMTLRDLIDRFGTDERFVDWLAATQKIEMINEKRLKNAEHEGRLVSRDLVKSAVIDRIDAVFVRMLTDGAKTIASRAHTMTQAGSDLVEIRTMIEDQLGSFIKPAKVKMAEALRDA